MSFSAFIYVLLGMSLIGFSIGYVFGFYFHSISETYFWAYLAAPLLGIGSGCVIYGALFKRKIQN